MLTSKPYPEEVPAPLLHSSTGTGKARSYTDPLDRKVRSQSSFCFLCSCLCRRLLQRSRRVRIHLHPDEVHTTRRQPTTKMTGPPHDFNTFSPSDSKRFDFTKMRVMFTRNDG